MPLVVIFLPLLRSRVSSTPMMSAPSGTRRPPPATSTARGSLLYSSIWRGSGPDDSGRSSSLDPDPSPAGRRLRSSCPERGSLLLRVPRHARTHALRKVARRGPEPLSSPAVGYASLTSNMGYGFDERTLPPSLLNGQSPAKERSICDEGCNTDPRAPQQDHLEASAHRVP